MRIGVFGGTFDPPHIAHLILADEARYQLHLDRILWVLTPNSPLKPDFNISPWHLRLELLEGALMGNPYFEVSRVDIDRPPPHYAFETLGILSESYPDTDLFFLMGSDSLRDLPAWKQPRSVISNCHSLGIMRRPGITLDMEGLESEIPGINSKVNWVDAPLLEISATKIRDRIKRGLPVKYQLPPAVFQTIQNRGLYKS
jgi:nicotinate-nucleotide adenylyltransferase